MYGNTGNDCSRSASATRLSTTASGVEQLIAHASRCQGIPLLTGLRPWLQRLRGDLASRSRKEGKRCVIGDRVDGQRDSERESQKSQEAESDVSVGAPLGE